MYLKGRQELLLVPHRSSGFQHPSASLEQAVGEEEENQQQLKGKWWCCCAHGTQLELRCSRVNMGRLFGMVCYLRCFKVLLVDVFNSSSFIYSYCSFCLQYILINK